MLEQTNAHTPTIDQDKGACHSLYCAYSVDIPLWWNKQFTGIEICVDGPTSFKNKTVKIQNQEPGWGSM